MRSTTRRSLIWKRTWHCTLEGLSLGHRQRSRRKGSISDVRSFARGTWGGAILPCLPLGECGHQAMRLTAPVAGWCHGRLGHRSCGEHLPPSRSPPVAQLGPHNHSHNCAVSGPGVHKTALRAGAHPTIVLAHVALRRMSQCSADVQPQCPGHDMCHCVVDFSLGPSAGGKYRPQLACVWGQTSTRTTKVVRTLCAARRSEPV